MTEVGMIFWSWSIKKCKHSREITPFWGYSSLTWACLPHLSNDRSWLLRYVMANDSFCAQNQPWKPLMSSNFSPETAPVPNNATITCIRRVGMILWSWSVKKCKIYKISQWRKGTIWTWLFFSYLPNWGHFVKILKPRIAFNTRGGANPWPQLAVLQMGSASTDTWCKARQWNELGIWQKFWIRSL